MGRLRYLFAAIGVAVLLGACGGGSSAAKEDTKPKPPPAADTGAANEVSSVCTTLCKSIANRCSGDPGTEFDKDACVDACTDETDGVLEDADRCVGKATACADAMKCREAFGD